MAKLQDCQFIEIKIDNKVIAGASEENKYKGWIEGYAAGGLQTISGPDGIYFDPIRMSLLMTKESSSLFEKYLKRGYKTISVTIVHRGSDEYDPDYEIQRIVYNDCKFQSVDFESREQKVFMNISFIFIGMVEVTFNIPNAQATGLDKIGPIKYDIPKKALL